jgi:hypothetical protein
VLYLPDKNQKMEKKTKDLLGINDTKKMLYCELDIRYMGNDLIEVLTTLKNQYLKDDAILPINDIFIKQKDILVDNIYCFRFIVEDEFIKEEYKALCQE